MFITKEESSAVVVNEGKINSRYGAPDSKLETRWFMGLILIIVLVLLLVGALPTWPHSSGWGYYPSGGLGLVLLILLIFVLMGRV